jgi:hypothetical protein
MSSRAYPVQDRIGCLSVLLLIAAIVGASVVATACRGTAVAEALLNTWTGVGEILPGPIPPAVSQPLAAFEQRGAGGASWLTSTSP